MHLLPRCLPRQLESIQSPAGAIRAGPDLLVHERSDPIAGVQAYSALPVHELMAAPPVIIGGTVIMATVNVRTVAYSTMIIVATTPIGLADDPRRLARRSKFD